MQIMDFQTQQYQLMKRILTLQIIVANVNKVLPKEAAIGGGFVQPFLLLTVMSPV